MGTATTFNGKPYTVSVLEGVHVVEVLPGRQGHLHRADVRRRWRDPHRQRPGGRLDVRSRAAHAPGACLGVALCGCVTNHYTYDWGDYDPSMYAYYKNPAKVGQFSDSLAAIVKAGDTQGVKVPPGIYAGVRLLEAAAGQEQ